MEDDDTTVVNKNEFLRSKSSWDLAVIAFLENYGWYLLLLVIAILCLLRKYQPAIEKYFKYKADKEYAAKYHKNPDLFAARVAGQEAATQKLQEKYAKDALEYQQKVEEKEAKKREEWLARQKTPSGHKLGNSSANKDQNSLKPEYNPLMGESSHSYRPQRRSACSGGGCGR